MPKRLAIRLINLVWYSTALLIVLAACLVTTGRELLPRINFDNKKIFQYASKRTGADIQAVGLRCQWTQLYPEFRANKILVSAQDLNVQMENVRLDIDILGSLLQKTPVFDRLELTAASILYRQAETPTATTEDPEKIWNIVSLIFNNNVHIQNATLEWHSGEKKRLIHLADFRVEKTFYNKKVHLRLLDDQGKENLYAVGELQGDSLRTSEGKLYIHAKDWQLDEWITLPVLHSLKLSNAEAWLDWQGMEKANVTAKLRAHPQADNGSKFTLPESIDTELSANWQKEGVSVIDIHSLALQEKQKALPLLADTRISVRASKPEQWRIQAPVLALQNLMSANDYVPAGNLKTLFQSLNPQGQLRNVDLLWDNGKPITERMRLRANADNISSGPWHGVPAFTGVSGYVDSGVGYGFIDLDSNNGFSMLYPDIYHNPIIFQRAAGRVQWHWLPERDTVLVGSDYASLSGEPGEARGNFWLNLPLHDATAEMYLAIGLRDSQAKYRDMFLPFILPADLLSWLKNSIGDANVPNAGFIYRGPLSHTGSHASAIQFYADINNADLQFDPGWPRLSQLNARLLVDDGNAIVRASSGQIYNSAIQGAYVEVLQQNPGLSINVSGRARGYAEDGLRILKETSLRNVIGNAFDSWRMPQGLISTDLQLQIPLAGATLPAKEDVRISLFDTQLAMDDLRLDFKAINGNIQYQTDTGLSTREINTALFDKPVKLDINSKKTNRDLTVNINAKGSANTADIANWSRLTPLKMLAGQMDYSAALTLGPFGKKPSAQLGKLQINSDLRQVELPLPAPFRKQRGEQNPFNLTVDLLRDNQQNYRIEYNKQLSGFINIRNGTLYGGELVLLGETAGMPAQNGKFLIRGSLPAGNLQEWLDVIAAYNQLPVPSDSQSTFYPSLSVAFNNATWKDMSFPKLQLSAEHNNDAWEIYFDSGNARGSAFFYDDKRIPDIALSELKIYRNKTSLTKTGKDSTVSSINFADVPSLNIRIDHLLVDDMDIGNISTELRSSQNALRFEKLFATGPGYKLRDGSGTTGSKLLWKRNPDGTEQSEFHGLLHMQGKQAALTHLGADMFIIGENVYLFADLTWPGTPQDASARNFLGNIYTMGDSGKYLPVSPNAAMRVLGVLDITTWARRLQLDFSDLGSDGISFDEYKGKLEFNSGVMRISEPLEIISPSSTLTLSGKVLLDKELLDMRLVATLPVGNNATWIAAAAVSLPAAAGVYLVSKVFDKQITSLTSLGYRISGPTNKPDVRFEWLAPPDEKAIPSAKSVDKKNKLIGGTK